MNTGILEYMFSRGPMYYYLDLARACIVEQLKIEHLDAGIENTQRNIIYTDFNVPAQDHSYLFNEYTEGKINKYGYIMCSLDELDTTTRARGSFENAFFIFDLESPITLTNLYVIAIPGLMKYLNYYKKRVGKLNPQDIFGLYGLLDNFHCMLLGEHKIKVSNKIYSRQNVLLMSPEEQFEIFYNIYKSTYEKGTDGINGFQGFSYNKDGGEEWRVASHETWLPSTLYVEKPKSHFW
jgi:hypothetical protein